MDNVAGVEAALRRKLKVYKANGNENAASIVSSILRQGVLAVKATQKVSVFDPHRGTGVKRKLVDLPTPEELRNRDAKSNRKLSGAEVVAIIQRMADDPIYAAEIQLEWRRPGRHSKARHHIAARAASKTPMLNADPQSIRNGLAYKEPSHKDRLVKDRQVDSLTVKPASLKAAKSDGPASWVERRWTVHTLKYSKGFVIVTDKGSESRVFPTQGELRSAIIKSGWEIVR